MGWADGIAMNDRKPLGQSKTDGKRGDPKQEGPGQTGKLSRDVQARLGQQLRAMYDEVVNQGVPDRFSEFLNRLTPRKQG